MTMADRIVVLRDGILQQVDAPQTLYTKPTNVFVAGFIGSPSMNFFDATLVEEADTKKLFIDRVHQIPITLTENYNLRHFST
jgi:multiple sugar transport system ATP-binding protein